MRFHTAGLPKVEHSILDRFDEIYASLDEKHIQSSNEWQMLATELEVKAQIMMAAAFKPWYED